MRAVYVGDSVVISIVCVGAWWSVIDVQRPEPQLCTDAYAGWSLALEMNYYLNEMDGLIFM
jgi:hypothetical protein